MLIRTGHNLTFAHDHDAAILFCFYSQFCYNQDLRGKKILTPLQGRERRFREVTPHRITDDVTTMAAAESEKLDEEGVVDCV